MNVSALEQVKRHLKDVLDDISSFHALRARGPRSWESMLLAVVDQLSAPIVHVIREGSPLARVPVAKAVGYKLAAGYFGAIRRLLSAAAQGEEREVTPESFIDFVQSQRLLVGGNEVCAGPPRLIEWTTRVFMDGVFGATPCTDLKRLRLATLLSEQVQLGLAWELFDAAAEARLLGEYGLRMRARSTFLATVLGDRLEALASTQPRPSWEAATRALPASLCGAERTTLLESMAVHATGGRASAGAQLEELALRGEGALDLDGGVGIALARHFATWLEVYPRFCALQAELETGLRRELGQATGAPIEMSALMMCPSRALRWFEAAVGHALIVEPGPPRQLLLRNVRRTVQLSL